MNDSINEKKEVKESNQKTFIQLKDFAKNNNGSSDFLLMQMAKNFGYKLAMRNIDDKIIRINRKNE